MGLMEAKESGTAPEWINEESYATLTRGYLLKGETVKDAIKRISRAAASNLNMPEIEPVFFEAIWNGWLIPASPIWSNLGTDRGLPISCNMIHVGDSVDGIFQKNHELAMLSKYGAGVGIYMGDVRGRNSTITGNGVSEGVIPWIKCFESTTMAVSQGSVRRGASATYLPIEHADYEDFLHIRKPTGDHNLRARNMNIGVVISDDFMHSLKEGNTKNRELWTNTLKERVENGEPYLMFGDTVNKANPQAYLNNNLNVSTSNICSEILLYTDKDHTAVCCLSSLNLYEFKAWEKYVFSNGMTLPQVATFFLDSVLTEYIKKASNIPGFEAAVRSSIKGRAIGIGTLGFHSLLQKEGYELDSFDAFMLNARIFNFIKSEAKLASMGLAIRFGEPEWCKGTRMRNTHLLAVAPNASSSIIAGGVSPSIEPINANAFALKSAKGVFIKKNKDLEALLISKGLNTVDVWNQIIKDNGSVQNIKGLSQEEKMVFLTARELNQHVLIKLGSQRQKFICQGQSLNLFFNSNASPKYIHEVHYGAWEQGIKTLYYLRSESVLGASEGDAYKSANDCKSCEG